MARSKFTASIVGLLSLSLAACTTVSQDQVIRNPKSVDNVGLCRTTIDAVRKGNYSPAFESTVNREMSQRGLSPSMCIAIVQQQDAENARAAAAIALIAVAAGGVAYCRNHDCSGGGNSSNYRGNCQYDWQTASDGSRCGHRSAYSKPGGY